MIIGLRVHHEGSTYSAEGFEADSTLDFLTQLLREHQLSGSAYDWQLLSSLAGKSYKLSHSLKDNQIHSRQDLYLKRLSSTEIYLEIELPGGRDELFNTLTDTLTSSLVSELVEATGQDKADEWGQPIEYFLVNVQDGARYDPAKTLGENGLSRGQRLRLANVFASAPVPKLRISLVNSEGTVLQCQAAAESATVELLNYAVKEMHLSPSDGKHSIRYQMVHEQTGEALDPEKSLALNQVFEGERLLIAAKPEIAPRRSAAALSVVVVSILVLMALAAVAVHRSKSDPGPPIAKKIHLDHTEYRVPSSGTVTLAALDENNAKADVAWSIPAAAGQIDSNGRYTAPSSITQEESFTVTATSRLRQDVSATGIIEVVPAITLSPISSTLEHDQAQQFTATLGPGIADQVIWTTADSSDSLSQSGLYTAPSMISEARTLTVTVALQQDPKIHVSATIDLVPSTRPAVVPANTNLDANQSRRFTVANKAGGTITWSINPNVGSINQAGVYTAPQLIQSKQVVKIVAKLESSQAMGSVSLQPISLGQISGEEMLNGSTRFRVPVSHTGNTSIEWSISPSIGSISSEGLFTQSPNHQGSPVVTVVARSVADPTKTAQLVFTVTKKTTVTIRPATASLVWPQEKIKLDAIVNGCTGHISWSSIGLGSIFGDGTLVAPKPFPSGSHTVQVTATCYNAAGQKEASDDAKVTLVGPQK